MSLIKTIVFLLIFFIAQSCYSATVFKDDFEDVAAGWNNGDGVMSSGTGDASWQQWDSESLSSMGCSDIAGAPSDADGYPAYVVATGGKSGKGLRMIRQQDCTNVYPFSPNLNLDNDHKDLYIGFWVKFDSGFKKAAGGVRQQCKWPFRLLLSNSDVIYFDIKDARFLSDGNGLVYVNNATFNGGEWWESGADQADFFDDHGWHWFEARVKLNSDNATSDGEVEIWVDGVSQGAKTAERFYTSGTVNHETIRWEAPGNCSNNDWYSSDWKGVYYDDFTVSTSYIGLSNPRSAFSGMCNTVYLFH